MHLLDRRPDRAHLQPRRCPRCEYNLYGLVAESPCPECGWDPSTTGAGPTAHADAPARRAAWCHCAGLVLLLLAMFQGLSVVLIERPDRHVTGNAPLLNVPGPKVWAAPALRRTTGNYVSEHGVRGVQTTLLCVTAVWLLTVPRPGESRHGLRHLTRWGVTLLGGANVGMAMGVTNLSSGGRTWEGVLLVQVAFIELPATALLYARLAQVAANQSFDLRRGLAPLQLAMPLLIAIAAGMLVWRLALPEPRYGARDDMNILGMALALVYGAAALGAGIWAAITVARLALALAAGAWPGGAGAGRALWNSSRAAGAVISRAVLRPGGLATRQRGRSFLGGALLALLLIFHFEMLSNVLGSAPRNGYTVNSPYLSYVGPKFWGIPLALNSVTGFAAMVKAGLVLALLTYVCSDDAARLGRVLRWGVILMIGAAGGITMFHGSRFYYVALPAGLSEAFIVLALLIEAPLNGLLYLWLGRLAAGCGRLRASRHLWWLAAAIPILQAAAVGLIMLEPTPIPVGHRWLEADVDPWVLAAGGIYGAAMFAVAVIATAAVLSLIAGLMARALYDSPALAAAPLLPDLEERPPRFQLGLRSLRPMIPSVPATVR